MSSQGTSASTVDPPSSPHVEAFLQQTLTALEPQFDHPPGRGRPRILPGLCLWAGLLVGVLHGSASQAALWRRITELGLWHYPRFAISDEAVYKRLATGGTAELERIFHLVSSILAERITPWLEQRGAPLAPFATQVVALDETTLDPVLRRLMDADGRQPAHLPGKLAGLFDIRCQQWLTVHLRTEVTQNEKVLARTLVARLPVGSLVLADLGYFGFQWFDDLTDGGQHWISRLRKGTSYEVIETFLDQDGYFDGIIWLGRHRADRAKHAARLVAYPHGQEIRSYITNVLDPTVLSMREIAALYARRWDIEMAVQLVKEHLGARLWWSSKQVVIEQQLWAVLTIAQIVQALRFEIAVRAGVDVFDVSLPLLVEYAPQFAARGEDPVAVFVERGRRAGFIRPSRRIQITIPDALPYVRTTIDAQIPLTREPRYANRKCGPR